MSTQTMALNAKLKQWLWVQKCESGSERQTEDNSYESQAETMVVNANDNYERQAEKDNSERRNREDIVALNTRLKMDDSERHNR